MPGPASATGPAAVEHRRGDIILMHFRPAFVEDFLAALRVIYEAGLAPALLEDYINLPGTVPDPATNPSATKSA